MLYLGTDAITSLSLEVDDPNKRTDATDLGTWSSTSDVDTFLSRFNHENNYDDGTTKLHLGDTIYIADGTYNMGWRIAGFDCEYNREAADDTVYNNGYGIMLYPRSIASYLSCYWNEENTVAGGYKASLAHSKVNNFATNMKNSILGTHLVNRNVLLSSDINSSGNSNDYTWTTAYSALPSVGHLEGTFNRSGTKYDDGEANYRLPLFNYQDYIKNYDHWLRNIHYKENSNYRVYYVKAYSLLSDIVQVNYTSKYLHPLLYIR